MSELSRTVQAGTGQVLEAGRGLATLRAASYDRKNRAMASLGASIEDLGATLKEHRNWADAKEAEDEIVAIENADAIALNDPEKRLVTLGATRVKHAKSAALLNAKKDDAFRQWKDVTKAKTDEAERFQREQHYKDELEHAKELTGIKRAELELAKQREARLGAEPAPPRNIDPNSPEGIAAAEERARRVAEAEAGVKEKHPAAPKEPDGLDQPLPPKTRALLEKQAGLDAGALDGFTFRDWNAMRTDPQEDILKQLRIIAAQRDVAEHEPPKLKAARQELERLQRKLDEFENRVATASQMSPMNPKLVEARRTALKDDIAKQQGVVGDEEKAVAGPPQAGVDPAAKAKFDALDDAQKAEFLRRASPEQKAKVGR